MEIEEILSELKRLYLEEERLLKEITKCKQALKDWVGEPEEQYRRDVLYNNLKQMKQ